MASQFIASGQDKLTYAKTLIRSPPAGADARVRDVAARLNAASAPLDLHTSAALQFAAAGYSVDEIAHLLDIPGDRVTGLLLAGAMTVEQDVDQALLAAYRARRSFREIAAANSMSEPELGWRLVQMSRRWGFEVGAPAHRLAWRYAELQLANLVLGPDDEPQERREQRMRDVFHRARVTSFDRKILRQHAVGAEEPRIPAGVPMRQTDVARLLEAVLERIQATRVEEASEYATMDLFLDGREREIFARHIAGRTYAEIAAEYDTTWREVASVVATVLKLARHRRDPEAQMRERIERSGAGITPTGQQILLARARGLKFAAIARSVSLTSEATRRFHGYWLAALDEAERAARDRDVPRPPS